MAGDLSDNSYAFTGQRLDPENNLYHFHFRKYDAEVGVWTTADPIGVIGGVNLYQYVLSNPTTYIDLLGMFADTEGMDDTRSEGSLADARGGDGRDNNYVLGAVVIAGQWVGAAVNTLTTAVVEGTIATFGTVAAYAVTITAAIALTPTTVGDATLDNEVMMASYPPGYWDAVKGAEEWGRRKGIGKNDGRRKFHDLKGDCGGSKADENFGVDPETGDVVDGAGDWVGNLDGY